MLQAAPNLESLTLSTNRGLIRNTSAGDDIPIIPELPCLRRIVLQGLDQSITGTLSAIIARAPHLEHVALRDLNLNWQSTKASLPDDSILDCLSCLLVSTPHSD